MVEWSKNGKVEVRRRKSEDKSPKLEVGRMKTELRRWKSPNGAKEQSQGQRPW
ncbi:MAG: hypothetical protein WCX31_01570 [Salinivirgaceae bacterium]